MLIFTNKNYVHTESEYLIYGHLKQPTNTWKVNFWKIKNYKMYHKKTQGKDTSSKRRGDQQ